MGRFNEDWRQIELEKLKCVVLKSIPDALHDKMVADGVRCDISDQYQFVADEMLIRLVAEVTAQRITLPAIRYPTDWKEAVKKRFFPKWALKRWPVRYTVEEFDVKVIYPMIALPKERHNIIADIVTPLYERGVPDDN